MTAMKPETISASQASWTSTIHLNRSAHFSVSAQRMFSAYVAPMSRNSGSPGNVPGAVSWTKTAEPSSSVLMPTRMAISQKSLRRRSRSATLVLIPPAG